MPGERQRLRWQPHGRLAGRQIHPRRCLGVGLSPAPAAYHGRNCAGGPTLGGGQDGGSATKGEAMLKELWQYVFAVLVWPGILGSGALGFLYLWIARKLTARLQGRRGP